MSIKPVDMQIMVQKTPDVARPVIHENKYPEIMQQNTSERLVKESLQNEERVLLTGRTENETVDEDGKGNAEYQRKKDKRRREKEQDDDVKSLAAYGEASQFDCTV